MKMKKETKEEQEKKRQRLEDAIANALLSCGIDDLTENAPWQKNNKKKVK